MNPNFKWIPSAATDVEATWRKHGWVPPRERPEYQAKWAAAKAITGDHSEIR